MTQIKLIEDTASKFVMLKRDHVVLCTRLQAIFNLTFSSDIDKTIHELVVSHAINAELMGPRGFDTCVTMLLDALSGVCSVPQNNMSRSDSGGNEISRDVFSKIPDVHDLSELIDVNALSLDQ